MNKLERPKIQVRIETSALSALLTILGLLKTKEKYQAEHPEFIVKYDFEV